MRNVVRYIVCGGLLLACGLLTAKWILGDSFHPVVATAKQSAKANLEKLVNEYSLALEKSKAEVQAARERAAKVRAQKHVAQSAVKSLERELSTAQREIQSAEDRLQVLRRKVERNESVRLASGRVASATELLGLVNKHTNQIEVARERSRYLDQILAARRERFARLMQIDEQSPLVLQRLENDLDFLSRKLTLYKELQDVVAEERATEMELAGFYSKAQKTLEDAHAKVDAKLSELDAILSATAADSLSLGPASHTSEDAMSELRTALAAVRLDP